MGFKALLCGKPLTTFGLPWYAGWGVNDDHHPGINRLVQIQRRTTRNLPQPFAAAYLQYSRHLNPSTGGAGGLSDVIDYLATVKRKNGKLRNELYCVGMSLWKHAAAKPFFNVPSCRLEFISSTRKLARIKPPDDARILARGNSREAIVRFVKQRHIPLLHTEDGFIRSVELDSNLVPPLSLVIDGMGIYFSAETPSCLEHILQNQNFDGQDFQTALRL